MTTPDSGNSDIPKPEPPPTEAVTPPDWTTPPPAAPAPPTPPPVDAAATPPPGAAAPPPGSAPYGTAAGAPPYGTTPPGAPPYGSGYGAPPPGWSAGRHEPQPSGLVFGVILVVVGGLFLALRLGNITLGPNAWPLWLVVPGLAMLIGSLFIPSRGGLGLAIPGAILAIIGGILWVQETYDLYATWAYAWALVAPTGPGVAMLLYGIVRGDGDLARDGLGTTLTGLGLFVGFGIFFEGVVGISGHRIENLDQVLPYAAIGLGVLLIAMAFIEGGRRDRWRDEHRAERRARRQAEKEQRRAEKAARRAGP
ncbi:MAG: hypothetical protein U0838_11300 [Chloroflexota bacterium]